MGVGLGFRGPYRASGFGCAARDCHSNS